VSSASRCPKEGLSVTKRAQRGAVAAYRVGDHMGKLFEAQLAIAVLVGLHDRLVHNFLELGILQANEKIVSFWINELTREQEKRLPSDYCPPSF
jgi:hypothetical protein